MEHTERPDIALDPSENSITIDITGSLPFEHFRGVYSYDNLPLEFRVIFENIQHFYDFLTNDTDNRVRIHQGQLYILVSILGRDKQFLLPLTLLELTLEEQLRRQLWQAQQQVTGKSAALEALEHKLQQKDAFLDEMQKLI
jgi:hypothetical protein